MSRTFTICLLLLASLLVTYSCNKKKLSLDTYYSSYVSFAQGTYIQESSNSFIYSLQYRPDKLMALIDLKGKVKEVDKALLNESARQYRNQHDFCLRIMAKDSSDVMLKETDEQGYYNRIGLLNADLGRMILGINGNDTSYLAFHHFERTYKLQPYIQVLFSFEKKEAFPETIVFSDEIFEKGSVIHFENCDKMKDNQLSLTL